MFVFLWGVVPSLGGCKTWSYIIHVWLMQNHSPTDGQSKEDGKGTTSLGEGNNPRLRNLREKGFYLPCTSPSIREVSGYSMFLNPCSMKCHHTLVGGGAEMGSSGHKGKLKQRQTNS